MGQLQGRHAAGVIEDFRSRLRRDLSSLRDPSAAEDDVLIIYYHRLTRRHTVLWFMEIDGDRPITMDRDKRWGRCVPVADLDLCLKVVSRRFLRCPGHIPCSETRKGGSFPVSNNDRVCIGINIHDV